MLSGSFRFRFAISGVIFLAMMYAIAAQIPEIVSFQGRLMDAAGDPVADGSYSLTFRIYDADTGGSLVWSEIHPSVSLSNGLFDVILGSVTALSLPFDQSYWVEITVDSNPPLFPRYRLSSSPYAFNAAALNGSDQVVRSIEGVSDAVDLVAGSNIDIDVTGNAITISSTGGSGGGDITAVVAGEGLMGGGDTGDVTLSVENPFSLSGTADGIIGATNTSGTFAQLAKSSDGIYGYSESTMGAGVFGLSAATAGAGHGLTGITESSDGAGVFGLSVATTGENYGVMGVSNSHAGFGVYGLYGEEYEDDGIGVFGRSTPVDYFGVGGVFIGGWHGMDSFVDPEGNETYTGVCAEVSGGDGENTGVRSLALYGDVNCAVYASAYGGSVNYGVYGKSSGTGDCRGVYGKFDSNFGQAVYGEATATTGEADGVWGLTESDEGYGVYGSANSTDGYPVGVYGRSLSPGGTGVYGVTTSTTGAAWGVYGRTFSPNGAGVYYSGGLAGSGSKNCVIRTSEGPVLMYCQESPESWFEDFGEGILVSGRCHVELDQLFLETVTINTSNPMKVFIELGGDCNGVFVIKGLTGFDVVELKGGISSVPFDYRIVARRKGFEEHRMEIYEAAYNDPYLYPDADVIMGRGETTGKKGGYSPTDERERSRKLHRAIMRHDGSRLERRKRINTEGMVSRREQPREVIR